MPPPSDGIIFGFAGPVGSVDLLCGATTRCLNLNLKEIDQPESSSVCVGEREREKGRPCVAGKLLIIEKEHRGEADNPTSSSTTISQWRGGTQTETVVVALASKTNYTHTHT